MLEREALDNSGDWDFSLASLCTPAMCISLALGKNKDLCKAHVAPPHNLLWSCTWR